MKKQNLIILAIIAFIIVGGLISFLKGYQENSWRCENGQWVKHGNPKTAMPQEPCGKASTQPQTMEISLYFNNSRFDKAYTCEKVAAVRRKIEESSRIEEDALRLLLAGPTEEEKANGYFSALVPGVVLNSLKVENNVARADFNEALKERAEGSCGLVAAEKQIVQTLKQFSAVSRVIISVDGKQSGDF